MQERPRHTARPLPAQVEEWLAGIASVNTRDAYRRDLEVFRGWLHGTGLRIGSLTVDDISAFRAHVENAGAGPATVQRRIAALSSFIRHTGVHEHHNPAAAAPRPSVPVTSTVALTDDERDRVWTAALTLGDKTAVVVGLTLLDGLKTKDLLLLDVESLHMSRAGVTIGAPPAGVRLHAGSAAAVRRHVGSRRSGPLLVGDTPSGPARRLTRFGVDYLVKRVGVRAGLNEPLTVSSLRRGRDDWMLSGGGAGR